MPLKTVVETLDGLDEAVQPLYTQTDAGFVLNVEGIDAHPDVANLKSAYERTKEDRKTFMEERDALKQRVSSLPDDFDPQKWEQLKKGGKADPDELVKIRETLEAERDQFRTKAEQAEARLRAATVERTLDDALTEQGITNPSLRKAARALLADGIQLDDKDRAVIETDMGPIPLAEHVKRWAASDEGQPFVTPPSGGGARGGKGDSTSSGDRKKASEMTQGEKGLFIREHGLDAWKQKIERESASR